MVARTAVVLALALLVAACTAKVTIQIKDTWYGGFKFQFSLTPNGDVTDWEFTLTLNGRIEGIQSGWVANANKISTNSFTLSNLASNGRLSAGQTLTNVVVVTCAGDCHPYSLAVSGENGGNAGTGGTGGTKNYGDALKKSILFYQAQRSGKLSDKYNPTPWRGDSAMNDCVVGGWYDAGDHVKFGLPFGFTTHMLLWGLYKFKAGYTAAGQLNNMYTTVKWATDYMLDAYNPSNNQLVAQIGDGDEDHKHWVRPETMTMHRPCHKVGPGKPAAELYGEWAASLAAGYLVWKDKGDRQYADRMLNAAKKMYAHGKANPGTYTNSVPGVGKFYKSTGYKDEMCLGAIWLYKATKEARYLRDAKNFHQPGVAWALSWDDKKVACQLLLYTETKDAMYKNDVENFIKSYMAGGSVPHTPCGLAWRSEWGSNRYAGNAAWIALAAADANINPGQASGSKFAVEQINYMLGDNRHDGGCFSFEIGYGRKSPQNPHHRGASLCANCVLYGALVGGPGRYDNYQDDQNNYKTNEVAIDYNAGFQSTLAAINALKARGAVPATNNKCPCH